MPRIRNWYNTTGPEAANRAGGNKGRQKQKRAKLKAKSTEVAVATWLPVDMDNTELGDPLWPYRGHSKVLVRGFKRVDGAIHYKV